MLAATQSLLVLGDKELGGSGGICYHCNVWRIKRKRNNELLSPSASTDSL